MSLADVVETPSEPSPGDVVAGELSEVSVFAFLGVTKFSATSSAVRDALPSSKAKGRFDGGEAVAREPFCRANDDSWFGK